MKNSILLSVIKMMNNMPLAEENQFLPSAAPQKINIFTPIGKYKFLSIIQFLYDDWCIKRTRPRNESFPAVRISAFAAQKGVTVLVESGAGEKAFCSNAAYENAGAQIKSRSEVLAAADIVLSIFQPDPQKLTA